MGCSRLQDLMDKGLLVPKWAWRSGVSVGLESRGYLCPTGAMNRRPSSHLFKVVSQGRRQGQLRGKALWVGRSLDASHSTYRGYCMQGKKAQRSRLWAWRSS